MLEAAVGGARLVSDRKLCGFFFPAALRYDCHAALYEFKVSGIMI